MKKKLIVGMAKSSLHWKPGQVKSLEVDVLRIALAQKLMRSQESDVRGYIMVATPSILPRIHRWISKWGCIDLFAQAYRMSKLELDWMKSEKAENREAISRRGPEAVGADASFGKNLLERALRVWISSDQPDATEISDSLQFPFDVAWDYFGIVEPKLATGPPE